MRTLTLSLVAALAATLAACTVQDVDTPQLAGPSSLARTIVMTADRDTLLQDGVSEAAITLRAQVQPGQSENVRLRAQVFVNGVAEDFGTLSNKTPITPTTIFYRAPAAATTAAGRVPQTITIAVTPDDSGDFRAEMARQLDLRLIPPGVILPTNPSLTANFSFSPEQPEIFQTVTFNASSSTNRGSACGQNCTYLFNFGDGTSSSSMIASHQYRTVGTYQVTLTVSDDKGVQATTTKLITVKAGTPPTSMDFTFSPTSPNPNQQVFFNASAVRPAAGRTLVSYEWAFGDGTTGVGITESHIYQAVGSYVVTLKVTDDAGAFSTTTKTVAVVRPQ